MIGAHLIQAGGAMALQITGYKDFTIRTFGRQTMDTWQIYIQRQILKVSEGAAQKMITLISYQNISFIHPPQQYRRIARNLIDKRHRPQEALAQ